MTGQPEVLGNSAEVAHVTEDGSGPVDSSQRALLRKRECHICKKFYVHLEAHIAVVHSKAVYKCHFCNRSYQTSGQLRSHVRWVHMLKNVECARRRQAPKGPAVTKTRIVQKRKESAPVKPPGKRTPNKTFCDICKTLVWHDQGHGLEVHLARHQRDPEYRYRLRESVKKIGEEDPVPVPKPKPAPIPKSQARVAKIRIPKPRPVSLREVAYGKCPYVDCAQNLESSQALALHFKESHPDFDVLRRGVKLTGSEEESPASIRIRVPCPDCGKLLDWTNLERHVQGVHRGRRNFHCDVCNKSFQQKAALQLHQKTKIHREMQIQKSAHDRGSSY